jgi:hypothetical protein
MAAEAVPDFAAEFLAVPRFSAARWNGAISGTRVAFGIWKNSWQNGISSRWIMSRFAAGFSAMSWNWANGVVENSGGRMLPGGRTKRTR